MYALEAELPKIAATKKEGLSAWYNLKSEDAHIYFDEHLKEEKHLEVWRKMKVSAGIATPSANVSLDAQHKVLDAVCDLAGIACAM
jgi:pyrroloquinoline quinone (PQQ) biosynthesis protein C